MTFGDYIRQGTDEDIAEIIVNILNHAKSNTTTNYEMIDKWVEALGEEIV